jgi:hypothetical protein
MKTRTIPFIAALCLLSAATAPAQTGGSPYEPSISSMQFETIVPLTAISGTNILFLNAPDVLAALQSGQLEMHESSTYDPDMNALKSVLFVVPTGTPVPAPQLPADDDYSVIGAFTMRVDSIYWNSYNPATTAAMIGRVSATPDRFKTFLPLGSTYVLSFAVPAGKPNTVSNVVGIFPGVISFTVAATTGSVNISPPSYLVGMLKQPNR